MVDSATPRWYHTGSDLFLGLKVFIFVLYVVAPVRSRVNQTVFSLFLRVHRKKRLFQDNVIRQASWLKLNISKPKMEATKRGQTKDVSTFVWQKCMAFSHLLFFPTLIKCEIDKCTMLHCTLFIGLFIQIYFLPDKHSLTA